VKVQFEVVTYSSILLRVQGSAGLSKLPLMKMIQPCLLKMIRHSSISGSKQFSISGGCCHGERLLQPNKTPDVAMLMQHAVGTMPVTDLNRCHSGVATGFVVHNYHEI